MRVLSQAEIDAMLANMLSNPTIVPGHEDDEIKEDEAAVTADDVT